MKHTHFTSPRSILGCCLLLFSSPAGAQQIVSRTLTDAIYRGDGVIDLLKDVSGDQLTKYFNQTGGLLLLGADINEDNSGNESRSSLGIAIKQAQLSINTTAGDFTFGDFYTSTTAMLREAGGKTSAKYYTMFGQGGSSQLTGKSGFDLSSFDDVLWLEKIAFTGTILRAELRITFLETLRSRSSDAESFFDFSGGFEDFALLSAADAVLLEEAAIGTADAPPGVAYTKEGSATGAILVAAPAAEAPPLATPPAAPAPPWLMVAGLAGLLLLKPKKAATHETR